MDFQTWAGMTSLKSQLADAVADLPSYRDFAGKVIYDLPDMPIVAADEPAPIRLLPEYDNMLIAHQSRQRVLPERHRKRVFLTAGRVASIALVDGFAAAVWKSKADKSGAVLTVSLFERQPDAIMSAIEDEASRLIRFIHDDASDFRIAFDLAA